MSLGTTRQTKCGNEVEKSVPNGIGLCDYIKAKNKLVDVDILHHSARPLPNTGYTRIAVATKSKGNCCSPKACLYPWYPLYYFLELSGILTILRLALLVVGVILLSIAQCFVHLVVYAVKRCQGVCSFSDANPGMVQCLFFLWVDMDASNPQNITHATDIPPVFNRKKLSKLAAHRLAGMLLWDRIIEVANREVFSSHGFVIEKTEIEFEEVDSETDYVTKYRRTGWMFVDEGPCLA